MRVLCINAQKKTRIIVFVFIVAIICLFALRIINLDQDIAPWGVSLYQPADEGPYAYLAINEKAYGNINPKIDFNGEQIPLLISENFITNLPGNLLNILSFHIFGNNYYGLRFPYILFGAINIVLFSLILNNLRKKYGCGRNSELVAQMALILWLVLDFSFFNASRIVEPTIVRLLFVQLTALVYIKYPDNNKGRYFALGVLITFSTFLVYITNVFLYLAVGIVIVVNGVRDGKKVFVEQLLWFILGSISMFVVVELYYYFIWHTEAIINAIRTIFSFSSNSSAELTINSEHSFIKTLALLYARIVSSNPFIYNLPLLFAGTIAVIPLKKIIREEKESDVLFLSMIVASFLLQTVVSTDTITRKMIVVFPVFVSILYILFIKNNGMIFTEYYCDKTAAETQHKKTWRSKVWALLIWIIGIGNVAIAFIYRTKLYDWTYADYDTKSKIILLVLEVVPLVAVFLFGLYYFMAIKTDQEHKTHIWRKIISSLFISMCLCNILFCVKYYWHHPEYTERDAMIKLADQVDDQYVLGGGFQLGWTLYNNMKPIVNTPEKTMEIASRFEEPIFLDYSNSDNSLDSYFQDTFYSTTKDYLFFVPYYEIERGYQTFGYAHNMCLYKVQNAEKYKDYLLEVEEKATIELKNAYEYLNSDISNDTIDAYKAKQKTYEILHDNFYKKIYPIVLSKNYPYSETKVAHIVGDLLDVEKPIYGDVMGDICGDINAPISGNIYGNIYGNVNAMISGNVYGDIKGVLNSNLNGDLYGEIVNESGQGRILGKQHEVNYNVSDTTKGDRNTTRTNEFVFSYEPIREDVNAKIVGDVNYPIIGNVKSNIYGDINANIYGEIEGNIYGDINAIIYGQIKGIVFGEINKLTGRNDSNSN